jgi:hypothetical protein
VRSSPRKYPCIHREQAEQVEHLHDVITQALAQAHGVPHHREEAHHRAPRGKLELEEGLLTVIAQRATAALHVLCGVHVEPAQVQSNRVEE